jgi:hypothetical protein
VLSDRPSLHKYGALHDAGVDDTFEPVGAAHREGVVGNARESFGVLQGGRIILQVGVVILSEAKDPPGKSEATRSRNRRCG